MFWYLCVLVVAYLLGSIPSGLIAGRLAGVDIRQCGSGNIGATNVTRTLGKKYGYPVFFTDFSKGLLSVLFAFYIAKRFLPQQQPEILEIVAAVFVVLGNAFPVWLRFRGGKGVAVSAGMLFGLIPLAAICVVTLWAVIFFTTGFVSLASVIAAFCLPFTVWLTNRALGVDRPLVLYMSIVLSALVLLRHRTNIVRLVQGKEEGFKKRED